MLEHRSIMISNGVALVIASNYLSSEESYFTFICVSFYGKNEDQLGCILLYTVHWRNLKHTLYITKPGIYDVCQQPYLLFDSPSFCHFLP